MLGLHEKENRASRRASPILRHRTETGDKQPLAAFDINTMESSKARPRKNAESSSRRLADHGGMAHLRSIYGGLPQKLTATLSSTKHTEAHDASYFEPSKYQGPQSDRGTVAELIRRFRMAPPAPREERNSVDYWWRGSSDGKSSDTSAVGWRGSSDGKSSDTSAVDTSRSEIEYNPSRRRATSAQSSNRGITPSVSLIQKRPLSANSVAVVEAFKSPQPARESPKLAYEYDAEIDQRLKGAEHLLSDWKIKKKNSDSSSHLTHDAKRQISATVSLLKRKYGIPTTSESSDTCVSDSESLAEPKKRYPQRLRMIVTGDVLASTCVDDAGTQVDVKEEAPVQQPRMQPPAQQSGLSHEPALAASLSICQSQSVSNSQAPPAAPAFTSASHDTNARNDDAGMQCPSDWAELDQCIYPVGSLRQTHYKPLESWMVSSESDSLLSCWTFVQPEHDCCPDPSAGDAHTVEEFDKVDDPIALMLQARERSLLAALSVLDTE